MGGGHKGGGAPAPAIEPVKSAEEVMKSAGDSSTRAMQLRKGIASTFMRPDASASGASATAGAASKLGG